MKPIDADALREKFADVLNSTYTDDYAKVFVAGLYAAMNMPTLTPPNEWVSVEERLPDKHDEYIVCACDEGEPIDERIWGNTVVVFADYYDGTFTWYEGNREYDISDIVTHWMPLPAPPDRRPPEGEANG